MKFELLNFKKNTGTGTLLATADLCFDGAVTICGVRLVTRKDGKRTFLSLPTRKVGSRYYPEALIGDNLLRTQIEKAFKEKYRMSEL